MTDRSSAVSGLLSARAGRLLASPPQPEYLQAQFARSLAPFDAATNPGGYIPMCIAENRLVWDVLRPKMAACRIAEPGFMRLCFASVPPDTAVEGAHRLARALRG